MMIDVTMHMNVVQMHENIFGALTEYGFSGYWDTFIWPMQGVVAG